MMVSTGVKSTCTEIELGWIVLNELIQFISFSFRVCTREFPLEHVYVAIENAACERALLFRRVIRVSASL